MSEQVAALSDRSARRQEGRIVLLLVKLAVSGILLYFLAARFNLGATFAKLQDANPGGLLVALFVLLLGHFCTVWRWRLILNAMGLPLSLLDTVRISFIGLFFNATLPSSVGGDAVRAWELVRRGCTASASVQSIIVDRISGLAGLVVVVLATQPLLWSLVSNPLARALGPAAVLGGALGFLLLSLVGRFPLGFAPIRRVVAFLAPIRHLLLSQRSGLALAGISTLGQMTVPLAVFLIGRSFGVAPGLAACFAFVPLTLVAMLLPVSIGGWGVREGVLVALLSLIHYPPQDSLLLSIAFGLALVVLGLPGGILWLLDSRRTGRVARGSHSDGVT